MAVKSLGPYTFSAKDTVDKFPAPLLYIGMIRTLMATDQPNHISNAQEGMLTEAGLDPTNPLQAVSLTSWVDGFMIGLRWERHVNEMTEGLSL